MTGQLLSPRFRPLPLGAVRPEGWLRNQLRIQADGLAGHLDEFWPDIKDSRWFGGNADGWERVPYWLDGLIPLAFLLDDAPLKDKLSHCVDRILAGQHDDGWLGPLDEGRPGQSDPGRHDLWAKFLALKALAQYHDATADPRVISCLERALRNIDRVIDTKPLFNWAAFRWFECLIPIYYLLEKSPEQWLLDLAVKLHAQGFDYRAFFEQWPCSEPTPRGRWSYMSHVVNNAMAVKAHALWARLSDDDADWRASREIITKLDERHGMVTGVFSGDECLAGASPVHGTELCAVVEYMYSLETLLSLLGEPAFGDRLEKIAFNALPATFSPDMWYHQYDQQVNQVACRRTERERVPWNTNGPDANLFGLEPNYGCCTANLGQGWPKFAAHLWMRDQNSLAPVAYAPSALTTEFDGVRVDARLETDYPFRDTLSFTITTAQPVCFALNLRVPAWADGATVRVDGEREETPRHRDIYYGIYREWRGSTRVEMTLPMRLRATARPRGAVALERGPLVYSLRIGEERRRLPSDKPPRDPHDANYEVIPATPWNYALDLAAEPEIIERPVGPRPFSPDGAPVLIKARARRLPEWQLRDNSADETPESPVRSSEPLEDVTLIPYGCTNLRVTEFPVLGE